MDRGQHKGTEKGFKKHIHTQVLQSRPVLSWCFLPAYVPLPVTGNASVPVLNMFFEAFY